MAGKRDIAFVGDAIISQMKTSLPAKLDSLDTEYGDGILLENIEAESYFISEKEKIPNYPVMCVIPNRTEVPSDGEYRYGIEYHYVTIAIGITGRGQTEEETKRRATRTVRAVEEVCLTNFTLNGSVADLIVVGKEYSPLVSEGNALLQEAQLTVRAMVNVQV
jgi:hypothetical protein